MSAPARSESTAAVATDERLSTALASSESVMTAPRKPRRERNSPTSTARDWEAIRVRSSAG